MPEPENDGEVLSRNFTFIQDSFLLETTLTFRSMKLKYMWRQQVLVLIHLGEGDFYLREWCGEEVASVGGGRRHRGQNHCKKKSKRNENGK